MSRQPPPAYLASDLPRHHAVVLPRVNLRLSAAERRLLLVLLDLLLLNASLLVAVCIWNGVPLTLYAVLDTSKWYVTLSALWLIVATALDLYNLARSASTSSIIGSTGAAVLVTGLIYVLIPWLTPPITARSYVFGFLGFGVIAVCAWRIVYAQAFAQPAFWRRVLILGVNEASRCLAEDLDQAGQLKDANPYRGTGYQVVGMVVDTDESEDCDVRAAGRFALFRSPENLAQLAHEHGVDEIVFAIDRARPVRPAVYEALLDCREQGLLVSSLAAVSERLSARLPVDYVRRDLGVLFNSDDSPAVRLYGIAKRLVDILCALLGLLVLTPLAPVIALMNLFSSPGPLFYSQERVGKGGRTYRLLKFRSMIDDAEKDTGPRWAGLKDPRVTRAGRLLRRTRLDELPQVINVLRGEMSVVGPRPERPHFVSQLARQLPLYRARHAVKPGITGWAQIHYRYGNSIEDSRIKLEYDLYYVRHATLYLDTLIMLQTLSVMIKFKGQ